MESRIVPIQYLDENNNEYVLNQTMTFLVSLYVNNLLQLYNMNMQQLKGNGLPLLNFGQTKPNYKPTEEERTIYFINMNGQNSIRQFNREYIKRYSEGTKLHANESREQT